MSALLDVLTFKEIAPDVFEGRTSRDGWYTVFGGQLIGQALRAATLTVEPDRLPHSLHSYFLRAATFDTPILFKVDRDREGATFNSRRVMGYQNDKPIISLSASFHVEEPGEVRDLAMPDVPPPETLASLPAKDTPVRGMEVKPIDGCQLWENVGPPAGSMWFRFTDISAQDRTLTRCLIAYASDLFLINSVIRPHRDRMGEKTVVTSLDHSLWIHDDAPTGEWMLHTHRSPWATGARGLSCGDIFARDGRHLASTAQEILMRLGGSGKA